MMFHAIFLNVTAFWLCGSATKWFPDVSLFKKKKCSPCYRNNVCFDTQFQPSVMIPICQKYHLEQVLCFCKEYTPFTAKLLGGMWSELPVSDFPQFTQFALFISVG